jgi:WD40 repeat protein
MSSASPHMAAYGQWGRFQIYTQSGEFVREIEFPKDGYRRIAAIAFNPNGQTVLVALDTDGEMIEWNFHSGQEVRRISLKKVGVPSAVAFSPNGDHIAVVSGKRLNLLDATTGAFQKEIEFFPEQPVSRNFIKEIKYSRDSSFLALVGSPGFATVFNFKTDQTTSLKGIQDHYLKSVDISPDGKSLFIGGDNIAFLWDLENNISIREIEFKSRNPLSVRGRFSMDGVYLITATLEGADLWLASTGSKLSVLPKPPENSEKTAYSQPEFSLDGKKIFVTAGIGKIQVWNSEDKR